MYAYAADKAEDVPSIVEGFYGAGRLNHGDIDFVIPDETVVTNGHQQPWPALASILDAYTSGVVKVFGESNATGEGGSTEGGSTGGETGGSGEGGSTGGSTGGSEGGSTVTPIEGTVTCSFAGGKASNSSFTVAGNFKNSTTGVTVDGNTYNDYLKLESSAGTVSFKTTAKMQMTCYTGDTKAKLKIDGADVTGDTTKGVVTVTLEVGDHSIAKAGSGSKSLYLIKLVPVTE